MPKVEVHTDDLPRWAVRKEKVPHSLLGYLREPVLPSPDGKMVSIEDIMMRQHFEAMLTGNAKARDWLLRKITKENQSALEASSKHPRVTIEGVVYLQPLAPVLALLGCIAVHEPEDTSKEPPSITLSPWFRDTLERHCSADKLAPVIAWLDAGGQQKPRIRDRDQYD